MGEASTAPTAPRPLERQNSLERARALVYRPPKSTNAVVPASTSAPAVIDPSFYAHMATYQPTDMGSVREDSRGTSRIFPTAQHAEDAVEGKTVGVSGMTEDREELRLAEERRVSGEERERSEAREQLRLAGERKARQGAPVGNTDGSPSSPSGSPSSSPLRPTLVEAVEAVEAVQRRLEDMATEQRGLREQQSSLEEEVAALRAQGETDRAQREAMEATIAQLQASVLQLQARRAVQRTRRRLAYDSQLPRPRPIIATAPRTGSHHRRRSSAPYPRASRTSRCLRTASAAFPPLTAPLCHILRLAALAARLPTPPPTVASPWSLRPRDCRSLPQGPQPKAARRAAWACSSLLLTCRAGRGSRTWAAFARPRRKRTAPMRPSRQLCRPVGVARPSSAAGGLRRR